MKEFLICGMLVTLIAIAIEDFNSRSFHFFWLILLTGFSILFTINYHDRSDVLVYTGINVGLVFLQFICLTFYFSWSFGKWIWIPDTLLGWGDILLLFPFCWLFSPVLFFSVYIGSLLLSLFLVLLFRTIAKRKEQSIPLASVLSFCFALLMVWCYFLNCDFYYTPWNFYYGY